MVYLAGPISYGGGIDHATVERNLSALLEAHVAHALGVPVVPIDVVLEGARP
jgi:hypothetical protein